MDEEENEADEEPKFWDDFPEAILDDLGKEQPLSELRDKSTISKKMTSLLQWFLLFILLWQANCKISNNGLEWLLRFLFQFLHLVGVICHCEYLVKFCTMFPTSLYVLRQLVNLDRDDFVKYVVCPNCSSLYDPGDCTQRIGGRIAAKCCIHKALCTKEHSETFTLFFNKYQTSQMPASIPIGTSVLFHMSGQLGTIDWSDISLP